MNKKTLKFAFVSTLPIMAGYIVLGIGFGVLLADKGYSFWWALLMSLTIYGGSMQFVGVSLLSSGASILSTALMTLMVHARHIFYGISMLEKYKNLEHGRAYCIFALTDETYSIVCNPQLPEGVRYTPYCILVSALDQIYWMAGTLIGAVLGNALPFDSTGIDFSMTALFVVIFVEQWENAKDHRPALIGLGISILSLLAFGPSRFLIPAMLGITAALFLLPARSVSKEVMHE